MATLHGNGTLPPAGPNTRQASISTPRTESSAARGRAFGGQRVKLHKGKNVTKAQVQLEYTQVRNSVAFGYSARRSVANVSTPAANTARQTALHAKVYRRNTAPYLHYLERKIDRTLSKIDLYNSNLESKVQVLNSKMSSNTRNLSIQIQFLTAIKDSHDDVVRELRRLKDERDSYVYDLDKKIKLLKESHDKVVKEINYLSVRKVAHEQNVTTLMESWKSDKILDVHELNRMIKYLTVNKDDFNRRTDNQIKELNVKKDLYACDLDTQIRLLNAKKESNADDLEKKMMLLSATHCSLARDLFGQIQLLVNRTNSYARGLERRCFQFSEQVNLYGHDIRRQSELVDSRLAPFVQDLDRQRRLLGSKSASFYQNCIDQERTLNSNMDEYYTGIEKKIELLKIALNSYFWEGHSAAKMLTDILL